MKKRVITILLLMSSTFIYSQVNEDAIRQIVLKNGITDSLYIFGEWNENGETETHLNYLGVLQTKKGNFKIMTSCWLWGLSRRATNRLIVYNENNEYLGYFSITMKPDLPEKIQDNRVVFLHTDNEDCDKKLITKLSFDEGIPKEFFLECEDGSGDFYFFNPEN